MNNILVDSNEPQYIRKSLVKSGWTQKSLVAGDYVVGDYIIERKTLSDLMKSIMGKGDNRYEKQVFKLQQTEKEIIVLIEGKMLFNYGFPSDRKIARRKKTYMGAMSSMLQKYDFNVIYSPGLRETVYFLKGLAEKERELTTYEMKELVESPVDGIGSDRFIKIIGWVSNNDRPWHNLTADEKIINLMDLLNNDLDSLHGVGPKTIEKAIQYYTEKSK